MSWQENFKKYKNKYQNEKSRTFGFRLYYSRPEDAHLMDIADSIPNKADWFRECLKRYEQEHKS